LQSLIAYFSPQQNIETFLKRFKKGSKNIRKIFETHRSCRIKVNLRNNVKTFLRLIGTQDTANEILEVAISNWNTNFYPNDLREFIFKFHSNLLGLNTRVSHFNAEVSRGCTFCNISNEIPVPDETFVHLFFFCKHTQKLRSDFNRKCLYDLGLDNNEQNKNFYFLGTLPNVSNNKNSFFMTVSRLFMYFIWKSKLAKNIPMINALLNEIYFQIGTYMKVNAQLREHMLINLHICRTWNAEAASRQQ
jgi:hypothetical protein